MTAPRHMSPGSQDRLRLCLRCLQLGSNFGFIPLRWNMVAGFQDASGLPWLLSRAVALG